ncbi:hypothetical protein [Marinicella meishanensis]|uniref:hypothetical protein n=1 Tax=Marinicella meishanensis TaxID=2873263 RepID=UPI001CBBD4F6|nr:hypothetical protein [Marinicella sp. NBU2979]
MKTSTILKCALPLLCLTGPSQAVQHSVDGTGEVLIYPYYTVNNDLNTLYSVVNTTADTKAIRINFLESDIGLVVLSFNVYLDAYDVWTGALVSSTSTVGAHVGEPNATHVTADTSCAPFLNKANQEFLPFVIDLDLEVDNKSMQRATEGHMEVIELATFTGQTVASADHNFTGVPANCAAIESDWADNEVYDTADEAEPTAGLYGTASIVNVAEGMAFTYDAIALQNFWQGAGQHTSPGELEPDLSSAAPVSKVLMPDGTLIEANWEHGFQAVSEVLTHAMVFNEYALETIINGRSEWVMNFPTKRHHTTGEEVVAPFISAWDGRQACDTIKWTVFDRESKTLNDFSCIGSPCPPRPMLPLVCQASNVMEFSLYGTSPGSTSAVLGSSNQMSVVFSSAAGVTESGMAWMEFPDASATTPEFGVSKSGLPVIGFAVNQFSNAAAAEGLLAQYGALFQHKYQVLLNADQ